jgi:lysozyme family protein
MAYSMMGATDTAWKLVNGVAKPLNETALAAFKALQSELSRLDTSVRADGDIGPSTVRAYNKISSSAADASALAAGALTKIVTLAIRAKADAAGLPPAKPAPASRPVVRSDGTFSEGNPPPMTSGSIMDFVTSPMGMIAGAGAIGLILLATRKKRPASAAPAALVVAPKVP